MTREKQRSLDQEWIRLLKEAKAMGLSKGEVQDYLRNRSKNIKWCSTP